MHRFKHRMSSSRRSFASYSSRRRKSRSSSLPPSLKDRRRRLVQRNELDTASHPRTADGLLALAGSRLTWARTQLYRHWNPELRTRTSPEMDARWWTANLLWALLPAALIAGYCEFIGQYQMAEYHQRQERAQRIRLLGEDAVQDISVTTPPTVPLLDRLASSLKELVLWISGGMEDTEEAAKNGKALEVQAPPVPVVATHVDKQEPTLAELVERLQRLEQALWERQPSQSGVGQRHDERLLAQWKQRQEEATAAREQETLRWYDTIWAAQRYLQEKLHHIMGSGDQKEEAETTESPPTSTQPASVAVEPLQGTNRGQDAVGRSAEASPTRRWWQLWK